MPSLYALSHMQAVPSFQQLFHKFWSCRVSEPVGSSLLLPAGELQLCIFEDNEAVIKMIIKGRSPTLRRVSRTYRVALDWLFVRINLDPKIQIKYVDTKNQLADILTKGSFSKVWELCGSGFRQSAVDHNRLVLALLLWYRLCCVFLCRRRTSE